MSHPLVPDTIPVTLEQLQAYYRELQTHDWYYEYAEDPGVYRRGAESQLRMNLGAKVSPQHKDLYDQFYAYYMKRKDASIADHPYPKEPTSL